MPHHNVLPAPGLYIISTTPNISTRIIDLIQPIHKVDEPQFVMFVDIWDSFRDDEGPLYVWTNSKGKEEKWVSHITRSGRHYPNPPMEKDDGKGKSKEVGKKRQ